MEVRYVRLGYYILSHCINRWGRRSDWCGGNGLEYCLGPVRGLFGHLCRQHGHGQANVCLSSLGLRHLAAIGGCRFQAARA